MSVFFRLHQDKSVGTKRSGKWYARMVPMGVIDTRRLAEIIQRNCTVKKSDVMAVIEELVETMRDQMQDGKRVKLDGFGSFKIGLDCHGADSAKNFSIGENVDGVMVFTWCSAPSAAQTLPATAPSSSCRTYNWKSCLRTRLRRSSLPPTPS